MVTEVAVWSVRVSGWSADTAAGADAARRNRRGARHGLRRRRTAGIGCRQKQAFETINAALVKAGATVRSAALVGSHATRYTVAAEKA